MRYPLPSSVWGIPVRLLLLVLLAVLGCSKSMAPPNGSGEDPPDGMVPKDQRDAQQRPDPDEGEGGTAPEPETVTVERYPRMVLPSQVTVERSFTVFVGLANHAGSASTETRVLEGASASEGQIRLDLPELPSGIEAWSIDVILSSADAMVVGDDLKTIRLPKEGSSTMARFEAVLPEMTADGTVAMEAWLFHDGAFMGRIGRRVVVAGSDATAVVEQTTTGGAEMRFDNDKHEIHLIALDDKRALIILSEPGKLMTHSVVDFDRSALQAFLAPKWGAIRARALDVEPGEGDAVGMNMVRGLGSQLWELVPAPVRPFLLRLHADEDVDALRLYSNVPGLPWELIRPVDAEGNKLEPLGTRFRVGRWHLRSDMMALALPPERLRYDELVAMVPTYEGAEALPALQRELGALKTVSGFRRVDGRSEALAKVVKDPPNGVLHFAGHGSTKSTGATTSYALRLEDGAFDSLAFVGLDNNFRSRETLVFFNACELGQADQSDVGIIEGWAPAMIDAGASGYLGALWPVGDDEAAGFAEAFYAEVERSISATGRARVTEVVRCLRKRGSDREDPTWQAYVFYGDPDTALYRPGSGEEDATYSCVP